MEGPAFDCFPVSWTLYSTGALELTSRDCTPPLRHLAKCFGLKHVQVVANSWKDISLSNIIYLL
jgi:hypothetical protein